MTKWKYGEIEVDDFMVSMDDQHLHTLANHRMGWYSVQDFREHRILQKHNNTCFLTFFGALWKRRLVDRDA